MAEDYDIDKKEPGQAKPVQREKPKFLVEPSPHVFATFNKTKVMWLLIIAMLPAAALGVFNFGLHALYIILTGIVSAVITEMIFLAIRKRNFKPIIHGSAVTTGLLIGLILPPTVPLWIPALGSFVALALAKHAFGGPGNTIFNPALVGRAFLVAAFPAMMSRYIWPATNTTSIGIDAITSASPLSMLSNSGYDATITFMGGKLQAYSSLLIGNISGCIGETSALALLIGGLALLMFRIIDWRIPVYYIGTVFMLSALFGQDPIFHILSGGLFIGAFFMATGYEGIPLTKSGRVIFGIGCGVIVITIRLWAGLPEGVNYSILLMNAATPFIERVTAIKPFGFVKSKRSNKEK
ncbi:RnfABCDGE type electron transport complex subunit D [Candidatus Woesearchaeota archaeon]|nr:RnfABCDGE type electron transport complex subunit D [Candidatus Woesearchaeota archaeon]